MIDQGRPEFDYDPAAADLFARNFLAVSQNGAPAQRYPYRFVAPSNTGAGVFWPTQADPLSRLSGVYDPVWAPVNGFPTSDHRLVWLDLHK